MISENAAQIGQMINGCSCCTIREDLSAALQALSDAAESGDLDFERMVIETTRIADPGSVAQTFFLDSNIAGKISPGRDHNDC